MKELSEINFLQTIIPYSLCSSSKVGGYRDPPPPLVVNPQYQHPCHRGSRGQHHHGGVVHAQDGGLVGGGQAAHHRHQEHRHVQHGGDAQRDLLS